MRAYSQDLRDRVISKYNTGEYQIKQLASMYQMSRQTIGEWVKRYKATGDYGSRQHLSKVSMSIKNVPVICTKSVPVIIKNFTSFFLRVFKFFHTITFSLNIKDRCVMH